MISRAFLLQRIHKQQQSRCLPHNQTASISAFLSTSMRFCSTEGTTASSTGGEEVAAAGGENQQQNEHRRRFNTRRIFGFVKDNMNDLSFAERIIQLKKTYRGQANTGTHSSDVATSDAIAVLGASVPNPSVSAAVYKEWLNEENASLFLNAVRFFNLSAASTPVTGAVAPRPASKDAPQEEKDKMKAEYIAQEKKNLEQIDQQKAAVEQWLAENVCDFKDPYYRVSGALTLLQYTHSATHIQEMLVKKLVPRVLEDLPTVSFGVFEQSLRLLHWCEMNVGEEAESAAESEKNKKIWNQVAGVVRQREDEIGNRIPSMVQAFSILAHYVPEHEVVRDLCDTLFQGIAHLPPFELSTFAVAVEIYGRASFEQIKELIGRYSTKVRSNSADDLKRAFPAIARIALSPQHNNNNNTLTPNEMSEIRDLMQVVLDESESQICSFMDSNFRQAYVGKNPEDVARIVFAYESFGRPSSALLRTYAKYIENNFAAGKMTPHCAALTLGVLSRTRCLTEPLAQQFSHYISNELLSKKANDGGYFLNLEEAGYCALGLSGFKSCESTVVALQKHILSNWSKAIKEGACFTTNQGRKIPMIGRSDYARQNASLTTAISLCRTYASSNLQDKNFATSIKPLLEVFVASSSREELRTLQLVQMWNALVVPASSTATPSPALTNPAANPVYGLLLTELKKRLSGAGSGSGTPSKNCLKFGAVELRLLCATSHRNPAITREVQFCINEFLSLNNNNNSSDKNSGAVNWSATTLDFLRYSSKLDKSGFAPKAVQTARALAVTGAQFVHFYELLAEVFPNNTDVEDFGRRGSLQLLKVDRHAAFAFVELARVKKALRPSSKEFAENLIKFVLPSGPAKMNFTEIANCLSYLALAMKFNFVNSDDDKKIVSRLASRAVHNLSTNSPITCHSSAFSQKEMLVDLLKSLEFFCSSVKDREFTEAVLSACERNICEAARVSRLLESDVRDNTMLFSSSSQLKNLNELKEVLKKNATAPAFVAPPQVHNFSSSSTPSSSSSSSSSTSNGKNTAKKAKIVEEESLKAEGKSTTKKKEAAATVSSTKSKASSASKSTKSAPASSSKKAASPAAAKKAAPAAAKKASKAAPAKKKGKK